MFSTMLWTMAYPQYALYADDPPADPPKSDDPPKSGDGGKGGDDKNKIFTQEQVNAFLAEDRRKNQKATEKTIQELEQVRKSKNLTEKEKETLSARIDELQATLMTKDELAAKERDRMAGEAKRERETLSGERDFWRHQFTDATIERTIMDEAVRAEAFSPGQIVALLKMNTRLVEVTDAEGKIIPGQFVAKVKFSDTDKEGKPVTLDLTVPEALKRMTEREDFGNLFKSKLAGGLGGARSQGNGKVDPAKMSPQQYREYRKQRDAQSQKK